MTPRLYRIILVTSALVWLQVGMHLSHVATIKDRGGTPDASESFVLILLAVWGLLGVVVLWQHPATGPQFGSHAPAA